MSLLVVIYETTGVIDPMIATGEKSALKNRLGSVSKFTFEFDKSELKRAVTADHF